MFDRNDFGSENIFYSKNKTFYLIDFEFFCESAPALTDILSFWIGKYHKLIKNNDKNLLKIFKKDFQNYDENEIILSFIYLLSVNKFPLRLLYLWKN